jgi:3',5'-nucleoside bisphosphate phosphatase
MIDLHVHTNLSDGTWSPEQVVRFAAQNGLRAIAITDHDTLAGVPRACEQGEKDGLEIVPGIELSTKWDKGIMHILGYWVRADHPDLLTSLDFLQQGRRERVPKILHRLDAQNIHLSQTEVDLEAQGGIPGRPHVGRVMVRKGFVSNLQEAFDMYLGKGRSAYVEKEVLAPEEAIHLLAQTAGICVLAHPYSLEETPAELRAILDSLKRYGLRGIEAYCPKHTLEETNIFLELARSLDLAVTGGTDFHGSNKPDIQIGVFPGIGALPYSLLADVKQRCSNFVASADPPGQWGPNPVKPTA